MRKETSNSGQLDRRRFLTGAGLAVGAVGAAAGTQAVAAVTVESQSGQTGYQETEHVKTYYDSARF